MMTVLVLAAVYGAYRVVVAAFAALTHLPPPHEDKVLF